MSRLNIPLSNNTRTRPSTRSRRVLWLGLFWLLIVLLSVFLAEAWFSRDTLSAYAPEDTQTIIHLSPSRLAWTKINEDFKNLPLISGRPLSFTDIFSFGTAELAIFVSEDGESSIAVRAKDKNIPFNTLNSYNITSQKLGRNKWLLSSKPLPFSIKGRTEWHFFSAFPGNIGFFKSNDFVGRIKQTQTGYQITIPKTGIKNEYLSELPDATLAAASIPSGQELNLEEINKRFGLLINPLEIFKITELEKKISENNTTVILAAIDNPLRPVDFLIKTGVTGTDLSQAMQTIAALQNPELKNLSLPDESKAQEITVNPQDVVFQTAWINGLESKVTDTPVGQIFALENQGSGFISSSSILLQEFIQNQDKKTKNSCGSANKLVFLKPRAIKTIIQNETSSLPELGLLKIVEIFKEMSISNGKIELCY